MSNMAGIIFQPVTTRPQWSILKNLIRKIANFRYFFKNKKKIRTCLFHELWGIFKTQKFWRFLPVFGNCETIKGKKTYKQRVIKTRVQYLRRPQKIDKISIDLEARLQVVQSLFQNFFSLCMVSVQERVIMVRIHYMSFTRQVSFYPYNFWMKFSIWDQCDTTYVRV